MQANPSVEAISQVVDSLPRPKKFKEGRGDGLVIISSFFYYLSSSFFYLLLFWPL